MSHLTLSLQDICSLAHLSLVLLNSRLNCRHSYDFYLYHHITPVW